MSRVLRIVAYTWLVLVGLWILLEPDVGRFDPFRDPMSYVTMLVLVVPAIILWQVAKRIDRKRKP